jgi:hypothetical protein
MAKPPRGSELAAGVGEAPCAWAALVTTLTAQRSGRINNRGVMCALRMLVPNDRKLP